MPPLTTWSGSLHLSYRLLPLSGHLKAFMESNDGDAWGDVFARMPFAGTRSESAEPDPRRYRDAKQLYETAGYLHQDNDRIWFTELGANVKRFLPFLNPANFIILARHAALALAASQLRNSTEAGQKYDPIMRVFPNKFIWQAMLDVDLRVSSDELNRAIFRTRNENDLREAIEKIRTYRSSGDVNGLGAETITGHGKNDRIIPIVSIAGFGWTLIMDKDESPISGHYHIRPGCEKLIEAAVAVDWPHLEFDTVQDYMNRISQAACLPKDLR